MKTLMIAPQPFFQPRGTPFSVLHRLKALSQLGYPIDLLTYPIGQNVEIDGVRIFRSANLPGVNNIAIGPSKTKLMLDVLLYRKAVAMLKANRYDLLHTHEEAGFMGIRLAKRFGLLHLYDMHSSLPQQLHNFKYSSNKLLVNLFETLERKTIESAQAVITICPELWKYVNDKYPGKFNKLIENVADNSLVFGEQKADPEIFRQINLNGETVILYTGTFEPYQGLDLLIEAAKDVVQQQQDVPFLIVGGKPEQVETYRQKVKALNLEPYFIFAGQRPPEEIPVYLQKANILVSPRVEGTNTPLKIYAYLRSGVPIVATRHITHTQVLNPDVAVLTDLKPQDFAAGILRVLQDPSFAQRLSQKARELAETEYSYEAYLQKTREVYEYLESLLKSKSRPN
ncbi:MAG: glycosyltransferase family 4 protein [candidate division KSB1 bacterium]|nr:glycosyltransferase family 4 protein [candidate division KSB1 bacterium]